MKNVRPKQPALALALLALSGPLAALEDATDLSLEDLLKTEVVTVARKSQTLQSSAAAVHVISRDDIERSGATSLPEALRLAPGVQVARISGNRWAVSVRGFNGRFSNKLLVLMDGRSIYSQLFSGVIWEAEDTLLEDIDRIEVIRGPGAAMWGANAVNGVINIITRKARDTQGDLIVAGAGDKEGGFVGARSGGATESGHFRVWGKAFAREESVNLAGKAGHDDWQSARLGFRGDWTPAAGRRLTVSGGAHQGTSGEHWEMPDLTRGALPVSVEQANEGAHVQGRQEWLHDDGGESVLQAYAESATIDIRQHLREERNTVDVDFQHRSTVARSHDLMWGIGYRYSRDAIGSQGLFQISPKERNFRLWSAFIHDDITLVPETLRAMIGTRLEHNNITGFAPQPNLRLLWTPGPTRTVWASAARAVRTPSRTERDSQADLWYTNVPIPTLLRYQPSDDRKLKNEKVTSYELGFRQQFGSRLSGDLALFRSKYEDLRSVVPGALNIQFGPFGPSAIQSIIPDNVLNARSEGAELAFDYHPTAVWRLQPSYTYLRVKSDPQTGDFFNRNYGEFLTLNAPRQQWALRSAFSLDARQSLDVFWRHVGRLKVANVNGSRIPSYSTLDLRYGWRFRPGWEFSLVGQNLLERRHVEFWQDQLPAEVSQIERGWYVKVKAQF